MVIHTLKQNQPLSHEVVNTKKPLATNERQIVVLDRRRRTAALFRTAVTLSVQSRPRFDSRRWNLVNCGKRSQRSDWSRCGCRQKTLLDVMV